MESGDQQKLVNINENEVLDKHNNFFFLELIIVTCILPGSDPEYIDEKFMISLLCQLSLLCSHFLGCLATLPLKRPQRREL